VESLVVNIISIGALKARHSKAQGGAKRNPGLGSEDNGALKGRNRN
jgi:hypothetical protein